MNWHLMSYFVTALVSFGAGSWYKSSVMRAHLEAIIKVEASKAQADYTGLVNRIVREIL